MPHRTTPPRNSAEQAYTVQEVARRRRVTSRTIRNDIKRKRLKAARVGRLLRITPEALADYERGNWK
jgi:excisionase family DNA binding protein